MSKINMSCFVTVKVKFGAISVTAQHRAHTVSRIAVSNSVRGFGVGPTYIIRYYYEDFAVNW
jgi:hypothetical protein